MKNIEKSPCYRQTLADPVERRKNFSDLPFPTKKLICTQLGHKLSNPKHRANLSRCWGRHRLDEDMIEEAEQMAAADKEEAAAEAEAQAAVNANANVNAAGEQPSEAYAHIATENTRNISGLCQVAKVHEKRLSNLEGDTKQNRGDINKTVHIATENTRNISGLCQVATVHEKRLSNLEGDTKQNRGDINKHGEDIKDLQAHRGKSEARLGTLEGTVNKLAIAMSERRPDRGQQQPRYGYDPSVQLSALVTSPNDNGHASPPRYASKPSAHLIPRSTCTGAKKMPPLGAAGNGHAAGFGALPSTPTDAVASAAPTFGSTFSQYNGFRTATANSGGGGGFTPSSDKKPSPLPSPKKLFGQPAAGLGGSFANTPSIGLATGASADAGTGTDGIVATTGDTGGGTDTTQLLSVVDDTSSANKKQRPFYEHPLNFATPRLLVLDGKWKPLAPRALYKIYVDEQKSEAYITIHDEGRLALVLNHSIGPHIKLEPNAGSDRSWVWTACDYSGSEAGIVRSFGLSFKDVRLAAAFKEKFEEAQKMTDG